MDERERESIIYNYIAAYNAFDMQGMIKDFHPSIKFENVSNEVVDMSISGIENFKAQAESASKLFSSRKQSVRSIKHSGNNSEVEIDYVGTVAIDLPNGLKKGDTIQLKGKSVFEFEDGRIIQLKDIS
jgi:hypothetical protein